MASGSGNQTSTTSTGTGGGVIGAIVLAGIIIIALLDAVAETIWSGSPIRWWIAPPIVLFIAAVLWLWRPGGALAHRGGPASLATTLVAGLLLLLAATAWIPGGQTNGVRMFGQPTSTVLAAAIAVAVALATYVILRGLVFLPATPRLVARLVFILIGLYALAAFGLAIKDLSGFVALFQGGALWQKLPRWLQGTVVGSLALVPIAILVQLGRIGGHLRGGQPVRVLIHQTMALVMSFVMALSGVVLPGGVAAGLATPGRPSGTAPPTVTAPTVAEIAQTREQLFGQQDPVNVAENFLRAAEAELNRPGLDPSDMAAPAAALGHDAGRIFDFMRDQVALEPYAGVLRGARGTLAAGAGNTLDRALLAQALLEAGGIESRLVAGRLATNQADLLLSRFLSGSGAQALPVGEDRKPSASALDEAARDVATKAGLPEETVAGLLRRSARRADAFWLKADAQRAANLEFLSGELRQGGVKPTDNREAVLARLRERLAEHYWLQIQDSSGSWVDFDPSFPESTMGKAYASSPAVMARIPADRYHKFEFSLVYRTGSSVKPEQSVLMKREVAAADALFAPLEFRLQPAEAMPDAAALQGMDVKQKIDTLRGIKKYRPLLRIGTKTVGGRAFDLEGHTFDAETSDPMGATSGLMGGMLGFGGEEEAPAFLDVQLVLRLSGPGREPRTQTRTFVRAADTKESTFAPPIGEWEILVQPQWISPELAGFQMLDHTIALTRSMTEALKAKRGMAGATPPPPLPQQLLQLALLRQTATADILTGQTGVRAFIDQPTLTLAGHKLTALRPDEGLILAERTIDIVENSVRFVGMDARSQAAAFAAALSQGAADCTLEQYFLQELFPDSAAESGTNVFERVRAERREPVLAAPKDQNKLRSAGLAESDVEWIRNNESQDATLLVAKASQGPAAWWSVQPDGTAVLRVSGGQGQGHAEHEVDVMLISLKVMFGMICGYEVYKAGQGEPSGMKGWKIGFCIAAGGASLGFVMAGLHAWSWGLICLEVGEFITTGIMESSE